jgi:hypothetical protein
MVTSSKNCRQIAEFRQYSCNPPTVFGERQVVAQWAVRIESRGDRHGQGWTQAPRPAEEERQPRQATERLIKARS